LARVLIVGCGCRGRRLAAALVADGHPVRGTTRAQGAVASIEATGAEGVVADPDRLGTVVGRLDGVSVVCWLMGSAVGRPDSVEAVNGARLEALLRLLVDTPVRGLVYEAAGRVPPAWLDRGAEHVRAAAAGHRMPVAVIERDPDDHADWLSAMRGGVERVLSG
jgi:nucleoside-diphosphate-sugar epimerase